MQRSEHLQQVHPSTNDEFISSIDKDHADADLGAHKPVVVRQKSSPNSAAGRRLRGRGVLTGAETGKFGSIEFGHSNRVLTGTQRTPQSVSQWQEGSSLSVGVEQSCSDGTQSTLPIVPESLNMLGRAVGHKLEPEKEEGEIEQEHQQGEEEKQEQEQEAQHQQDEVRTAETIRLSASHTNEPTSPTPN